MGTMMPLSQAIIGDLIPPRDRGRYQGLMGAVFGLSSVIGPLVGGYITDHFSWRWLFLVNPPVALLALGFIVPFMKLPAARRRAPIDYAGFVTLSGGLTLVLLATVWGGTSYPWGSPVIIGLFAGGGLLLAAFVAVERRAVDPVMPLRLWKSRVFALANLANMAVAMAMFGAIYFIPVFVQGVIGISVTASGAVLTPMMLALVACSAINGQIVSRTGRYKIPMLVGILLIAAGFLLLAGMGRDTTRGQVVRNMIVVGAGLGMCMQLFVLVVQNAVAREDLGVATATTQLFRSIGSSVGIAVLGTVMTQGLAREVPRRLGTLGSAIPMGASGGEGAGAVLDPEIRARLPAAAVEALRGAFAASLHPVFVAGVPMVLAALAVAVFIPEVPLRRTPAPTAEDAGRGVLAEMAQAGAGDGGPTLGTPSEDYRARTAFLGLLLTLVADAAEGAGDGRLHPVLLRLGEGDASLGRDRARRLGQALLRESDEGNEASALDPLAEFERALAARPADFRARLRRLLQEMEARPTAVLTHEDVDTLERIAVAAGAAALLDRRDPASSGPLA